MSYHEDRDWYIQVKSVCADFEGIKACSPLNHLAVQIDAGVSGFYELMSCLKLHKQLDMAMLIDVCVVDYLHYKRQEWQTTQATATGYSRGVVPLSDQTFNVDMPDRFQVIYQLLSLSQNKRLTVAVMLEVDMTIASIAPLWPSANWFEREAFDLFGVRFKGHPDLTRILTDYGFKGHPFRKDFPLEGELEIRYDAKKAQCVYEPVSIEPRITVPKVIRNQDFRYHQKQESS